MLRYELIDLRDSTGAWIPFQLGIKGARTPLGFKMFGIATSIHHKGMRDGTFERDEVEFLSEQLQAADVFVDVGANIGYYVCLARHAGKHVVAVEPQAKNLRLLYKNLQENGYQDVEVYPMCVSDNPGLLTRLGPSSTGASLVPGWAGQSQRYRTVVPVSTLDVLLSSRFRGKKLLVKIDVEGAEHRVLQGAMELLNREPKPTWVVEICLNEHHPEGINPYFINTFQMFWKSGYQAFLATTAADRSPICPEDLEAWVAGRKSPSGMINYVFVPA